MCYKNWFVFWDRRFANFGPCLLGFVWVRRKFALKTFSSGRAGGRPEPFANQPKTIFGPKNAFFRSKRRILPFSFVRKKAKLCANFKIFKKRCFCDLKCQGRRGGQAPGAEVAGPSPLRKLWVSLDIMFFGRRLPVRAESRAKSHPVMVWLRFGSDWAPGFGSKPVRTRRSRRFALSRASSALNRTRASRAFPLTSASSSRGPTRAELACRARSQRQ